MRLNIILLVFTVAAVLSGCGGGGASSSFSDPITVTKGSILYEGMEPTSATFGVLNNGALITITIDMEIAEGVIRFMVKGQDGFELASQTASFRSGTIPSITGTKIRQPGEEWTEIQMSPSGGIQVLLERDVECQIMYTLD